jgi:hypothetical protein
MEYIDDIFVVIQKSDRQMEEKEVCKEFNIRYILMPDNGKMASGFKEVYNKARNETLLFLENDFIIKTSKEEVLEFLLNSLYFLHKGGYDIVRGRSRDNPGVPNHAYNNMKDKSPYTLVNDSHLSESIYWDTNPDKTYPSKITRIIPIQGDKPWYTSSSKSCNYTNNPFLCTRTFFKEAIYPHLYVNENIEDRITPLWSNMDYKCVFGPGLFTHDRSYDGHD